ncbi:hypothetical protein KR222_010874, partial [Zaprionus bogoriensis]
SSIYSRRQAPVDVFHNDPFKVQSYTFRYAEKPYYPVQQYQRPEPPKPLQTPRSPPFETYYVNAKFKRRQELATKPDPPPAKPEPAPTSFIVHRRRKLQEDYAPVPPKQKEQTNRPVNSPLLRTCCNREEYQAMRRVLTRSSTVTPKMQPARSPSAATFRSNGSGCAININISGLTSDTELDKTLRIQIEADPCVTNNKDKRKSATDLPKVATARCVSSESFKIDKRLSKFVLPELQPSGNWMQRNDLLLARRLQVQEERQCLEQLRQQELEEERQRARQREEERERLRQLERERDCERIRELEAERERQRLRELEREQQRLRELERETQRRRDYERACWREERLQRARSMPTSMDEPKVMTSHLYRLASTDRLPGMAPCYVHLSELERSKMLTQRRAASRAPKTQPEPLERRSSGTSNNNASVLGNATRNSSNVSLRRASSTRLNECKLLNLQVNGIPVSSNQPIHTRINNMPIRITTSQPADEHLQFSVNQVREQRGQERRRSSSRSSRTASASRAGQGSSAGPYNVNINVYADNPRTMRL